MSASLQLLLLDDNADDALLIRELLQSAYGDDMTLDHAITAAQATELIQDKCYDLFLVDYMLGEPPNGAEWLAQTAKNMTSIPPAIMLTGLPDARQIEGVAGQLPEVAYFITKDGLSIAGITQAVNFALANQSTEVNRGTILMADDDVDDILLVEDALLELKYTFSFDSVQDGAVLMDYLYRQGKYTTLQREPLPGLILLDLNMPKKDGRQALAEIRKDAALQSIPVVVFSTSSAEEDVHNIYDLGANSFVTKPDSFDKLVQLMDDLTSYWFGLVSLPGNTIRKY